MLAFAAILLATATAAEAFPAPKSPEPSTRPVIHRIAVFGTDERRPLPKAYRALDQAIGMLYSLKSRTLCTAFCVDDDIIATAAHCFFRTDQEPLPNLADFAFRRGGNGGRQQSPIAGSTARAKTQFVVSGSMRLSVRPPIEASRDWALARLARPICRGHALKLEPLATQDIAAGAASGRMFQIAYHRDFADWRIAYSRGCDVQHRANLPAWKTVSRDFVDPQNLILHTCDTGGASSGSPLLMDGPDGPRVVGINVGTYVQSKIAIRDGSVVQRFKAQDIANTGVNISALTDKLAAFRQATIIQTASRIRSLQAFLKDRETYEGSIDGAYGPKLRAAIESYERAQNLPVTGLATETLLRRLADTRPVAVPHTTGSLPDKIASRRVGGRASAQNALHRTQRAR